jgi:hypothetical protein
MDTKHKFSAIITLGSGPDSGPVDVSMSLDGSVIYDSTIGKKHQIILDRYLDTGCHKLTLDFFKSDADHTSALMLHDVSMYGISDKRFIWRGIYRPRYPEPWASQQIASGVVLEKELRNTDYLGWGGTWTLEFSAPIFTWIHQVQGLGWIFD